MIVSNKSLFIENQMTILQSGAVCFILPILKRKTFTNIVHQKLLDIF